MQNKVVLKRKVWTMCKYMVSMETGNAILKNGGRPRNSIISQLLLILDKNRVTKLKPRHRPFIPWSDI